MPPVSDSATAGRPRHLPITTLLHAFGVLLVCSSTWLTCQFFEYFESPILATLGIISGYYSLLSCWMAYGKSLERWLVCLGLVTIAFWTETWLLNFSLFNGWPKLLALFIVNAAFLAAIYLANLVLIHVTKMEFRRFTRFQPDNSLRLRFGIGELMLGTAFVAVILAISNLGAIALENEFLRTTLILVVIGLFHFILFWPLLISGFRKFSGWFFSSMAILTLAITIPSQVYVFSKLLGDRAETWHVVLLLDIPFIICLAVHFGCANCDGYRLVIAFPDATSPEPALSPEHSETTTPS